MSRGTHAAGDGSFGRSAGSAGLRGLALIIVAVVIGVVLLNRAGNVGTGLKAANSTSPTTARHGHGVTTTSVVGPTTTTLLVRPPQDIRTLVANSTSVLNQAARYTGVAKGFGYNTLPAVDSTKRNLQTSIVYYEPGYNAEAAVLATKLGLPKSSVLPMPATPPVVYLNSANLLVIVGLDLANSTTATTTTLVHQAPATTAPARTTTTVHS